MEASSVQEYIYNDRVKQPPAFLNQSTESTGGDGCIEAFK